MTASRHIIDLHPFTDEEGRERFVSADAALEPVPRTPIKLQAANGAVLDLSPTHTSVVSVVPPDTMAATPPQPGPDYNAIVAALNAFEAGTDPGVEPRAEPGGGLVLHRGDQDIATSKLPTDTMAAWLEPTADRAWIDRFDPHNRCQWRWHGDDMLPGWYFRLDPFANHDWVFYAASHPSYGGRRIVVILSPDYTKLVGHREHVLTWNAAGTTGKLPIICKTLSDHTCAGLSEAHGLAAKFRFRNGILLATGQVPFS